MSKVGGPGTTKRVIDSYNGVPCDTIRPDTAPNRPGEPCGEIHQHCRGHVRALGLNGAPPSPERLAKRGDPCRRKAMKGQLVCQTHGGAAPAARAKAERTMAKERALGEVGKLIAEALQQAEATSKIDQLGAAIDQAYAMWLGYRWLLDQLPVQSKWSFEEHTSLAGSTQRFVVVETEGLVGPDAQGVQRLHAYEEGMRYWLALHGKLLKSAADIGLEERRQRFAQEQVASIGTAIRTIVQGLGRELDDPQVVPVVEQALRSIAGPSR